MNFAFSIGRITREVPTLIGFKWENGKIIEYGQHTHTCVCLLGISYLTLCNSILLYLRVCVFIVVRNFLLDTLQLYVIIFTCVFIVVRNFLLDTLLLYLIIFSLERPIFDWHLTMLQISTQAISSFCILISISMIIPAYFKILELIHQLKVGKQGKCFHYPGKNYHRTTGNT